MNKNNNISAMKEECERILCKFGTPSHVIEHCKAVCEVATAIGTRLNESNKIDSKINIELLFYSAMLHDIARVHENHEEVGADYLQGLGYDDVATIVRQHTIYSKFNDISKISEIDILCIADRTTLEDEFVGIAKRMEYIKTKAEKMGRKEFLPQMDIVKLEMENYVKELENVMGITVDALIKTNARSK